MEDQLVNLPELYKDLLFMLDDRGGKTPLLINRKFMKDVYIAIDPSRKYILTDKSLFLLGLSISYIITVIFTGIQI